MIPTSTGRRAIRISAAVAFLLALAGAMAHLCGTYAIPNAAVDGEDAPALFALWSRELAPVLFFLMGIAAAIAAILLLRTREPGRGGIALWVSLLALFGLVDGGGAVLHALSHDRARGMVIGLATPSPAPTAPLAPPGFQLYRHPSPVFSLAVPAAWTQKPASASQVFFDGTAPAGAFSFGDDLLVTWLSAPADDAREYDESCGSHVCGATLTLVRHGHLQLKLRRYWDPDFGPAEGVTEKELGALGEKIAATIR